jgi:hypothetical protein
VPGGAVLEWPTVEVMLWIDANEWCDRHRMTLQWQVGMASHQLQLPKDGVRKLQEWMRGPRGSRGIKFDKQLQDLKSQVMAMAMGG